MQVEAKRKGLDKLRMRDINHLIADVCSETMKTGRLNLAAKWSGSFSTPPWPLRNRRTQKQVNLSNRC